MDKMDPRRTIGATVHTKAMHNTSEAECIRRYGSNNKTKIFKGKVLSFDIILKEGWQSQLRKGYKLSLCGGVMKQGKSHSKYVKPGPAPVE